MAEYSMNSPVSGIILAAGRGTRMHSPLPKVLHEVQGKPMICHSIELFQSLQVQKIVIVVGYKHEMIEERAGVLGPGIVFALQREQLGTGDAVLKTQENFQDDTGYLYIIYGDMPLLKSEDLQRLMKVTVDSGSAGAIMTLTMENPPEFGRVVRDDRGKVLRIVEVQDASPEIAAINEVNVGVYFFHVPSLFGALRRVTNNNAKGEYYLTDVVGILAGDGKKIETVSTQDLDSVFGINQPFQLEYAGKLAYIHHAEGLYQLIDAVAAMQRKSKRRE